MRNLLVFGVMLLVCGLFALQSLGDDAQTNFDAIFGPEAARVRTSNDKKQQTEFAKKLLKSANDVSADRPLQLMLIQKAYEFALAGDGDAVAKEAQEVLTREQPSEKVLAGEMLLNLQARAVKSAVGPDKLAAANLYLDTVLQVAQEKEDQGDLDGADAIYVKAKPTAELVGAVRSLELAQRRQGLAEHRMSLRRRDDLKARFVRDPNDTKSAAELVRLTLVEIDSPPDAILYVGPLDEHDPMRTIATLAAADPASLSEQDVLRLADWYKTVAGNAVHRVKDRMLAHAAARFTQFVSQHQPDDAAKLRAKLAIEEIAKVAIVAVPAKTTVNLLPLIDLSKDTVNGNWQFVGDGLVSGRGHMSRVSIPYQPPDEYDMHVQFTRNRGGEGMMFLSHAGHSFMWTVGAVDNTIYGFGSVRNLRTIENETSGHLQIVDGQRYDMVVQVRKDGVHALVDGKSLVTYKTNFSELNTPGDWTMPEGRLGVGGEENTFHVVEITEIAGQGKRLTHARP